MLKEVVDNGIDEFIMGAGKRIEIKRDGAGLTIRDYGRGIPLGKLVDCVSQINTGGKYSDDVFQFSVGLNGVGTKAVNALSQRFSVTSWREGKFRRASFARGKLEADKTGKDDETRDGTEVCFEPDPEIFGRFAWNEEFITDRLRYYAFLNAGLTLEYQGKRFVSRAASRICWRTRWAARNRSTRWCTSASNDSSSPSPTPTPTARPTTRS